MTQRIAAQTTHVDAAVATQLRNIESDYGRPVAEWLQIIQTSGKRKHNEVVEMLKTMYGMKHGAAHRLSLISRQHDDANRGKTDYLDELYSGKREPLRAIHDTLIQAIERFDGEFQTVPKRGYVSLRRANQFAMIQPSTIARVDLGLILPGTPPADRLESATKFNALFTHRVRLATPRNVDRQVIGWLRDAYERAAG